MVIGITTTYSEEFDYERVNTDYVASVYRAGGVPLFLPPVSADAEQSECMAKCYLDLIDGLILSGGGDIDPLLYGESIRWEETNMVYPPRDALELALAREAYVRDMPTLGICRGSQVINVALGGTLCQDVMAAGLAQRTHKQEKPYTNRVHRVKIKPHTLLEKSLGNLLMCADGDGAWLATNSIHHQAVQVIAKPLEVAALSEDGVIEALEAPAKQFYMAVQWHPECLPDQGVLFDCFVEAVRTSHKERTAKLF